MSKNVSFSIDIQQETVKNINPNFLKATAVIMHTGLNYNGSVFSKDAVEKAIPTLYNVPVVAEYIEEIDDFGTHGGKIEITSNGIKYVQTTKALGVVPESANPRWENINGKECLVADVYLWARRFREISKFIEDGEKPQSMEVIAIDESEDEQGFDVIEEFVFDALCMLGSHVQTGMEGAKIYFSLDKDEVKSDFEQLMKEVKMMLQEQGGEKVEKSEDKVVFVAQEDVGSKDAISMNNEKVSDKPWGDVDKTALHNDIVMASNYESLAKEAYLILEEGWETNASNAKYPHHEIVDGELVVNADGLSTALGFLKSQKTQGNISDEDYDSGINHLKRNYDEADLEFPDDEEDDDTEDMTKEFSVEEESGEDVSVEEFSAEDEGEKTFTEETTEESVIEEVKEFAMTANQKFREFYVAVDGWDRYEDDKNYDFCYVLDYTDSFVYVNHYGKKDGEKYDVVFRYNYVMSEDGKVAIEMETKAEVFSQYLTQAEIDAVEMMQKAAEEVSMQFGQAQEKIAELEAFRDEVLLAQKEFEISEIVEEFEPVLGEVEEFIELKSRAMEMEVAEFQDRCFAIEGRIKHSFSGKKKEKVFNLIVPNSDEKAEENIEKSPYGQAVKYLKK